MFSILLIEVKPPEGFEIDLKEFKAKDGVVRLPLVNIITDKKLPYE